LPYFNSKTTLTESFARLGFDERTFLAVVLNSRFDQAEAVRTPPEPGVPFTFQVPLHRRACSLFLFLMEARGVSAVAEQRAGTFVIAIMNFPIYLSKLPTGWIAAS